MRRALAAVGLAGALALTGCGDLSGSSGSGGVEIEVEDCDREDALKGQRDECSDAEIARAKARKAAEDAAKARAKASKTTKPAPANKAVAPKPPKPRRTRK